MSRPRFISVLVMLLPLISTTGCHGVSPPASPQPVLSGTWVGDVVDEILGRGVIRLVMSQQGMGLTGNWTATFTRSSSDSSGTLSGTLSGATASLYLTPGVPLVCPAGRLSGTRSVTAAVSDGSMTGRYVGLTCDGVSGGELDVHKVE